MVILKKSSLLFGIVALCLFSTMVHAKGPTEYLSGLVVAVSDGDTITVSTNNEREVKIRFYGIDSPEKAFPGRWPSQPYSQAAKQFVSDMILNRNVSVRLKGEKTYERYIGEVFYNGYSVNREVVRAGLAWWNKKYEPYDFDLMMLEQAAKDKRAGLWAESTAIPPWQWRKMPH